MIVGSGRRRSCAVHTGIRASLSPTLPLKIKSTPLSCVSPVHTASRRIPSTRHKRHSPSICRQCSSMSRSLYRQHGPEPTATTAEVRRVVQGQSRLPHGCVCGEDDDSGCKLLPDEMKLRQPESLANAADQQHYTRGISRFLSRSRTVLLNGAD